MENQKIIDALYFCAGQCLHCYDACQREEERGALQRCMQLDQDCADICRLTAQLFERNSENSDMFLKLCGDICEKCAMECEKHMHLEHCQKCADACHKCMDICHQYVH